MTKRAIAVSTLALSVVITGCTGDTSQIGAGDVVTWKCDKEPGSKETYVYKPYEYFVQTDGDVIGVSGSNDYKSTLLLETHDKGQTIPASWTLESSYDFEKTADNGFTISGSTEGMRGKSISQSIALNGANGKLRVQNGSYTTTLKCKRVGNWKAAISESTHGPNETYINSRLSMVPFLRKKLGDPSFSAAVARESNQNDDHKSVYSLLAPLRSADLTTQEKDLIESAKKKLIDGDSNSYDVWEWNNSWEGGTYFQTDDDKANLCRNMSGSTYAEGYKIVSSTSQDRIGGTNLTCHGTLHLLRKEGSLQADRQSPLIPLGD